MAPTQITEPANQLHGCTLPACPIAWRLAPALPQRLARVSFFAAEIPGTLEIARLLLTPVADLWSTHGTTLPAITYTSVSILHGTQGYHGQGQSSRLIIQPARARLLLAHIRLRLDRCSMRKRKRWC